MTAWCWLALGALALAGAAPRLGAEERLIHAERSLYRQVLVYEQDGTRCLCFTRACAIGRQSCIVLADPDRQVFEYTRMMLGALLLNPAPRQVLVIGLGGGTLPRALARVLPGTQIDVVEIDPAVVRVAHEYFGFRDGPHLAIFEEDGRAFVRRALREGHRYDLVMLDAYDNQYIPEHLLTREFLQSVRALLNPGAVVAANTFSTSHLYPNESATYRDVFGDFYNLKRNNRVILARPAAPLAAGQLEANRAQLAGAFSAFGFDTHWLLPLFSTAVDWDPDARILTDQYSPANLLNR